MSKFDYLTPEFEIIKIRLSGDILGASQEPSTEDPIKPTGDIDPTDPFGDEM